MTLRTAPMRQTLRSRRGFALPTVLIMTAVLSAAVAAALTYTTAEGRVYDGQRAEAEAFMTAQVGLEKAVANLPTRVKGWSATKPDTAMWSLPVDVTDPRRRATASRKDTAYIKAYLVRANDPNVTNDSTLWLITSRGVSQRAQGAGGVPAERIVASYVWIQANPLKVNSAMTSLVELQKAGGAGLISGVDECHENVTGVPGVLVPTETYSSSDKLNEVVKNGDGTTTPHHAPLSEVMAATPIDWAAISTGTLFPPTFTATTSTTNLTTNPVVPQSLCTDMKNDPDYYPVILIKGNVTLNNLVDDCPGVNPYRATLIVTGDLNVNGSVDFRGTIFIGRQLTSNGGNKVYGAVNTGLNVLLPGTDPASIPPSEIGDNHVEGNLNGTKQYLYDSCDVRKAMASFARVSPMTNVWFDNWPSYQVKQ